MLLSQLKGKNMSHLNGKVAVVTGASKGIGAGIAKDLAAHGASLVVNYSSSKAGADKVVAEITKAGGKAIAVGGSVAKSEDIDHLFAETKKAYGKVDILVNNAGVYSFSPIETLTTESMTAMFSVNVFGLMLATKAAVPLFPEEGGSIINIGSVVGEIAPPQASIYAGTKGALNSITRVFAKELAPKKIRVNAVNPGAVRTEGFEAAGFVDSPFEAHMIQMTPLGRVGMPKDIADLVTYLASENSGWVTGSLIDAAGGWR
jgi:3-oxoacyl-[acyl-carrier protein] reductase